MTSKPPLRPATPIDAELAKPAPEEITEMEKEKQPVRKSQEPAAAKGD